MDPEPQLRARRANAGAIVRTMTSAPQRRATVYVHFPYCLQKCPYCDFVSYARPRSDIDHDAYSDAVIAELEARSAGVAIGNYASIFFGGGTPSLWRPDSLARVIKRLYELLPIASDAEVTVECNPSSLDGEHARRLHGIGVNRLSIGVQSLRNEQLKFLGRLHDADRALAVIAEAVEVPGLRVSGDMIFGLPEQSVSDAVDQASRLADTGILHMSCYQLTIEPGTRFGELAKRGRLPLADDGKVADSFFAIDEALQARGFGHYEISNYAHKGQESRHNLGYWSGYEYLGLGCGAYGFVRPERADRTEGDAAVRYRNAIDPDRYVAQTKKLTAGTFGADDGLSLSAEAIDGHTALRERIMLGLRLADGFDLSAAGREWNVDPWTDERERTVAALSARGRLIREEGRLRIPKEAWHFTDDTAARLF
jgi:oxygen-independent coproporphyrinogen-3 oxidase